MKEKNEELFTNRVMRARLRKASYYQIDVSTCSHTFYRLIGVIPLPLFHPQQFTPATLLRHAFCWRLVVCGAATNRFLRKSGTWRAGAKGWFAVAR